MKEEILTYLAVSVVVVGVWAAFFAMAGAILQFFS